MLEGVSTTQEFCWLMEAARQFPGVSSHSAPAELTHLVSTVNCLSHDNGAPVSSYQQLLLQHVTLKLLCAQWIRRGVSTGQAPHQHMNKTLDI